MAEIPGGQFSVFYFSGPSHLILINGEASLFFRRFINLMCARRHFNHKSGILGLENSRRGDSGRDKNKPEVRSRDGAALAGVWGGSIGRAPLQPLLAHSAGDTLGCDIHQRGAPPSPPPPVPGGGTHGGGNAKRSRSRPASGSDRRLRIPVARTPGGGA